MCQSSDIHAIEIIAKMSCTMGEMVIPFKYSDAHNFHESYAAICLDGLWGFINLAGQIVIEPQYEKVTDFSEGLATVYLKGIPFVINKAGEIVIR